MSIDFCSVTTPKGPGRHPDTRFCIVREWSSRKADREIIGTGFAVRADAIDAGEKLRETRMLTPGDTLRVITHKQAAEQKIPLALR